MRCFIAARRVFERIEIEYAHHGGTDSGKLAMITKGKIRAEGGKLAR
jgi:hypothetical protein